MTGGRRPLVPFRFTKWGGARHWEFDVEPLGSDEHGRWFGIHGGTRARKGLDEDVIWRIPGVVLVPERSWWTAVFNGPGHRARVYCDITTPARWVGDAPTMVDLDLDVIEREDGSIYIDDEDEFEEHRVALGYPQDVVASALASCATVFRMVSDRAEPFGDAGATWLGRFLDEHGG